MPPSVFLSWLDRCFAAQCFWWEQVGYGDITAQTSAEMVMSVVAEMLGGMIFGILVGVVGTSITAGRMADQKYREQMEKIGEYMRIKQVPLSLRRRIRVFYENLYKQTSVFDEAEFLAKMSPQLKTETVQFIYRNVIGKVPILRGLPEQIVHKICLTLCPYTAVRGDVIMRDGEEGDCFFIIIKGEVKMSVNDPVSNEDVTVGVFGEGSFFGEEAVVSFYVKGQNPDCSITRSETAMAVSDSQLAFMRREEAGKLMDDYEVFKMNMLQAYRKRQQRSERIVQEYSELHDQNGEHANADITSGSMKDVVKKGRVTRAKRRRASVVDLVATILGARHLRLLRVLCSKPTVCRALLCTLTWPLLSCRWERGADAECSFRGRRWHGQPIACIQGQPVGTACQ